MAAGAGAAVPDPPRLLGRPGARRPGPQLAVKGAPEVVLPLCARIPGGRAAALREVRRLAAEGLRVLAVARRRSGLPATLEDPAELAELARGLQLVGFVGLSDAPRPEAAPTVRRLAEQGIRVVMLTGDHPLTAAAIARQVGVPGDTVVTGDRLDRMTERERIRCVAETGVFARVSPEHKVRIVEALRAGGRVIAMAGEGTNDAAAIRLADVDEVAFMVVGTGAWAVGRLTGRRARASTMGLAAVVGTQLGQTLLTNWRSPLVVATSMGSAAALAAVIETPGVSQFFGCTPLGPVAWGTVLVSSAGATAAAAAAPDALARLAALADVAPLQPGQPGDGEQRRDR